MTTLLACRRRLNPFQLPTATTGRFVLLVLLTLAGSAYTYDWYFGGPTAWRDRYSRCDAAANSRADMLSPNSVTGNYLGCLASVDHDRFVRDAAAVVVVALVIVAVHMLSARVLIWWRKLVPPPKNFYSKSVAEVEMMIGKAGLRRAPTVLIDLYRDVLGGRVFGCFGRYYLRLNVSVLRGSDAKSKLLRRAIVRHELAHLRNRDVDVTSLTITAGRVLPLAVLAPLVVLAFGRQSPYLGEIVWRAIVVLILVIIVRAALIRSREHYADVAASNPPNAGDELGFVTEAFPERQLPALGSGVIGRLMRWLAVLVQMHPSGQWRSSVVADPGLLLTLGGLDSLAIGLTMGLSLTYLFEAVGLFIGAFYGHLLAAFLLGLAAIGALVAGLWRATLRALATQTQPPTGTVAGVGLWTGLLLGQIFTWPFGAVWPTVFMAHPMLAVIEAAGLLVSCLIFTWWSVGMATAWLPAARGRSLRPTLVIGQLVGVLAFSGALELWLTDPQIGLISHTALDQLLIILFSWYTLVPILLAIAFPLAAALCRSTIPVPRAVWLNTPNVALPAPRFRMGAVLIPPLAVLGTALLVELLAHDPVSHLILTVTATHGWGRWGQLCMLMAMEIAPTFVIVPLVLALTFAHNSTNPASAHAVPAAMLSSFFTVFVVTVVETGGSRVGWMVDFPVNLYFAEGLTLCLALVLVVVIYLIHWPLHRLRRGSRRQWPTGQIAADHPPRRPTWLLRWSLILLVLAMFFIASYGSFGASSAMGIFRPPPIAVPAPSPATHLSTPTAVVCSRDSNLIIEVPPTHEVQLAIDATTSTSPGLNAFGVSLADGLRTADPGITKQALLAIEVYCMHASPQSFPALRPVLNQ